MKGWKDLVEEAVTRIINEEIKRVIGEKFPEVRSNADRVAKPGFDYSMRRYIEERYTEIMKADPEIDAVIKQHLRDCLIRGLTDEGRQEPPHAGVQ